MQFLGGLLFFAGLLAVPTTISVYKDSRKLGAVVWAGVIALLLGGMALYRAGS